MPNKLMLDYDLTISSAVALCLYLNQVWRAGGGQTYCVSGNPEMPMLVKQASFIFDEVHVIAASDHAAAKLAWLRSHNFGPNDLVLDDSASNCTYASEVTNAAQFIAQGSPAGALILGRSVKRWTGNKPVALGRSVRRWSVTG